METRKTLGNKLRDVREERGFSQRELAQRAGISTNAVSLIERDENSPSVSTLQSLAMALNIKMSYFFNDEEPVQIMLSKSNGRPAISSHGMRIEGTGGKLSFQELEPFLITLKPNSGSGERQVVHTGHELVYCLSGNVEYLIDGQIYPLETGDMLLFEAHLPHLYRNVTGSDATMLLVLQTSGQSTQSVDRHFPNYPSLSHIGI